MGRRDKGSKALEAFYGVPPRTSSKPARAIRGARATPQVAPTTPAVAGFGFADRKRTQIHDRDPAGKRFGYPAHKRRLRGAEDNEPFIEMPVGVDRTAQRREY